MATIYFIKADYAKGIYKRSNFFNSNNSYIQDPNVKMDVDMRFNDGLTEFITPYLTLPNGTNIHDYTHITVPEKQKIYRITKIDALNYSSAMIYLEDDPLLAHLPQIEWSDIVFNRSNNIQNYKGVNDTTPVDLEKKVIYEKAVSKRGRLIGRWGLLFFKNIEIGSSIKLVFDPYKFYMSLEVFDSKINLEEKYPPINYYKIPYECPYFEKVARVYDGTNHYLYQFLIISVSSTGLYSMNWVPYNSTHFNNGQPKHTGKIIYDMNGVHSRFRSSIDKDLMIIALPFNSSIRVLNSEYISASFLEFSNSQNVAQLADVKIIDSIHLDLFLNRYYQNFFDITIKNGWANDVEKAEMEGTEYTYKTSFFFINDIITEIDITPNYITPSFYETPPFKTRYLSIYNDILKLTPTILKQTNKIYLMMNLNEGMINYVVYLNQKNNILMSGSFTNQGVWKSTALDAFNQQNPTYKDQFNLKQNQALIEGVVGTVGNIGKGAINGALAGSIGGPLGAAGGALIGGVGAGLASGIGMIGQSIKLGYNEKQYNLMIEGLSKQPSKISGNLSDINLQILSVFGVFYYTEEIVDGHDEMGIEFDFNGYPCNFVSKLNNLSHTWNKTLQSNTKLVYGSLLKTFKNSYVTNEINKKLAEGIIILP